MKEDGPQFEVIGGLRIKKGEQMMTAGETPAVVLCNPKYPHNVGAAIRACSCFNGKVILFSGTRIWEDLASQGKYRLPREERMKGYEHVKLISDDYPLNRFERATPVAVEVRRNAELLPNFIHPDNPVYVFGPEDGSIPQSTLRLCQRFLYIPSPFCTNLAAAVYLVLYDRMAKLMRGDAVVGADEREWVEARYLKCSG